VEWELVRVREDRAKDLLSARYFGNDLRTAEATWLNNVDPFPLEMLWEGPGGDYFVAPKEGAFAAQTAVVRFLKARGIAPLQHADWVVDLGTGRGGDLNLYLKAGVRHLVAVDSSRAALTELVRRRLEAAFRRGAGRGPGGRAGGPAGPAPPEGRTALHVLAADAARPAAETAAALGRLGVPPGGADALVCNLAVHYFLGSAEGLRNFAALAGALVRPGGRVVLTFLDGARVHALLRGLPEGGSWDLFEGGVRKFSLRRHYAAPRLEAAGQRIAVLLHFAGGEYYEEFLVNVAALSAEMKARGFAPEAPPVYAADLVGAFRAQRPELAGRLSPQDLEYLTLIMGLTFLKAEAPAARRGRG
jgi:SAM-dependent methyltransferase